MSELKLCGPGALGVMPEPSAHPRFPRALRLHHSECPLRPALLALPLSLEDRRPVEFHLNIQYWYEETNAILNLQPQQEEISGPTRSPAPAL